MAYIRTKTLHGNKYFFLVEGKNIDGKVKQKVLKYLGTPETIVTRYNFFDKHNKK